MSGINTGLLYNAQPLSTEQITALEERVIEHGETFVYLDENSKLCFAGPFNPEVIKDLAWHNACILTFENELFVKKVYKKLSLKNFYLEETLQKQSYEDPWLSISIVNSLLDESLLDEFILE